MTDRRLRLTSTKRSVHAAIGSPATSDPEPRERFVFGVAVSIALLLILMLPRLVRSQSLDIVLRGKVSDQTGLSLPGGTVTAIDKVTGIVRSAVTDGGGFFVLLALPASTYDIRVELNGFVPKILPSQALHVGTTVDINVSLKLAGIAQAIEVRELLPVLETSKNTIARLVQAEEIDGLPVIDRNFNDLAALTPGVTKTGVYGGVDISGSRDFQNAYQVDGVSSKRQRLGDQQIPYAQDWIQEFQVMSSQFNPEFGQASGGVLNAITRSGGNLFVGRLYGFLKNDALAATPAFATRKPRLREHRIGATLGGPIVEDRLFYFVGIESFRNASNNIVNSSFPSANGTFPSADDQTLVIGKLDAVINRDERARVRYNGQRERTDGSSIGGISTQEHGRFANVRANNVVGNWTSILSPRMLNETRIAWGTSFPQGGCNYATQNTPGAWFERAYPAAQFGCPVNFGTIAENQSQFIDNLTWTRGPHEMKLGVQLARTQSFGDFRNLRDGRYAFERDLPFNLADPNTYPFSFTIIDGPTTWNLSSWSGGAFVQDSWRLRDDLTLNLGMRYDIDASLTALNPLVRVDNGLRPFRLDLNNLAPRIGAAWTPFHNEQRTLLRGGAGLYYDQNHNNLATALLLNNILVNRVLTVNANNALLNPFSPDIAAAKRFLAEALAQNRIPDLSTLPGVVGATNNVDPGLQIPATLQVSGGLAHDWRRWLIASADMVYARGFDLYVIRDVNIDPGTFRRVNPNYSSISSFGNGGWNEYRALQVQVTVLPSAAQFLKIAYTLATNRSNTSSTLSAGAATNPFDYSEDTGPTDNDVRHHLTMNGSTKLPLGVQASGILSYRSALPYSVVTAAPRPDGKPFAFRPEPRNARRGDSECSLDLRVAKIVKVGVHRSATVFVEMFNVTNAVNYGGYVGTMTSSLFGQPTTAGPPRRTQLGFRLDF